MKQDERRTQVERLTDHQIIEHAKRLARAECEVQLELLYHIAEIEKRRLHLGQGYSSVFDYLVRGLGYSTSSAHRRLATARAIRDFPRVHDGLVARQLNMSTIALLQPVLTADNEEELVGAALGRSQNEVEALVARFRPAGRVRDRIVPIRIAAESPETRPAGAGAVLSPAAAPVKPTAPVPASSERAPEPGLPGDRPVAPVVKAGPRTSAAEVRSKVVFSASAAFAAKVEKARALLSGKLGPGASLGEVMEALVDLFLERESPEKRAERREARAAKRGEEEVPPAGNPSSRHIPARVRDDVRIRDGGRCTFVGPDGVRCSATRSLEYHHDEPYGMGGETSVENVRLACRRHNQLMAEQCYGQSAIERARTRAGKLRGGRGRGNGCPSPNSAAELDALRPRPRLSPGQS